MIRALFSALGRFLLFLCTLAFVAAVSLFVFGSFILTWPILRLKPRDQKLRATVNFASAAMTMFTVFGEASARRALAEALELAEQEHVLDPDPDKTPDPEDEES